MMRAVHTVDFTLLFTAVAPGDARVSLLRGDAGVGASPRVWSGAHTFDVAAVDDEVAALGRALRRAVQRGRGADALAAHGRLLFDLLLPTPVKAALRAEGGGALTVAADGVAVPWSALHDGAAFLAHRWALGELSPGDDAPAPPPPMGADRLLVVADPAGDLPAARYEGEALVRDLAGGAGGLPCDLRLGSLRRADFLRIFKSFRLVHFAGHADPPDADGPAGWRLADGRLDADALRALGGGAAPSLVFANACRSAEAFASAMGAALQAAGVRHFVGTRVDLPDLPGADFAGRFYEALRGGVPVGEALRAASVASAEAGTSVWAAYRLVGDPRAVYFRARAAERFAPGVRRAVVLAVRRPPPVAAPDLLAEQLEAWRASLRDRVAAHGGRLLPGRGAVDRAVFGLPVSYENDLARAARAALAAHVAAGPDAVVTLEAGPLASTGADVLGAPAQQAEAACWRLPPGVWALPVAAGRLEAAELTDDVAGGRRRVGLPPRAAGAEPPLVGRRAEMARLEALADEVAARGVARAVTLVAPAGMGKSRLVSALLARLADRFTVLRGASIPYDEVSPFAAAGGVLLDLVDAFGPDAGPLDARLTTTLEALERSAPGDDEPLDAVLSIDDLLAADDAQPGLRDRRGVLAPLLGLDGDDRAGEAGLVPDVFRQLIEAAARRHPVVVVFEDLHWLPDAGLAVVDELANGLRGAPVLLVCTARSELLDRAPHVFDAPSHVRLDLGPLSPREAEAVLRQALPAAVDAETVAALSGRAEGNPLFLRELALARAAGEVDAPPATVEAVMRARLDRLPPFEQEVLRAASVLGRTFWREGVDRLLGGVEGLDGALRGLERGRFVVQQAQSDLPGQTQWRFGHALLHEVVAHGIGTRARVAWHGRAALWLTDEVPDAGKADRWARVATHRAAAGDHARAAEAWLLAGARAAETLAPVEARRALEAALGAGERPPAGRRAPLGRRRGERRGWRREGEGGARRRAPRRGRPTRARQPSSDRTTCGCWLACASTEMPACCTIWLRDSWAVSAAKSASRMRLREADRFSLVVDRLLIVDSKRFWMAPRLARMDDTCSSATSTISIVRLAVSRLRMSTVLIALLLLRPISAVPPPMP